MQKLAFLGRSRVLGFNIGDCRNLLALWDDRDRASTDVRAIAKEHLPRIESKIADFAAIRGWPIWCGNAPVTGGLSARS
ncbi:Transcriptional regulator [Sulfitobacter guttiformis KCTC 32187]|nr:Transcriptional regulator [Sulfitobacter guttiformis KCTC 32187]